MYWPWEFAVMVDAPIVIDGAVVVVGTGVVEGGRFSVVVLEPTMRTGWGPDVCSMTGVAEAPVPMTRGVLGERVCPAIM